ncbi:hypothetical protein [Natrinema longum]|uniref:HIT zinc finger n=1 Tax=Natrinema longum TaxID=370324 RepID=A0A8A2UBZ7_9EURY|nr:hypothetical protein [Natrinema longum]MBZ6495919.1 hypothetical protein [Natrinema longum]QSW86140.1 hypothetical protein J0X27_04785 [Natrinema longum]
MSVSGLCQICESRPAANRCPNCGTLACEVHFDESLRLCADCASQAQPGPGNDDVEINRF